MAWNLPPQICQWDITSKCNLSCSHCRATSSWDYTKDIETSQVLSILRELFKLAPEIHLALAGGEPLMRDDFQDILRWIRKKYNSVWVGVLTNGTLINRINVKWLAKLIDGFNIGLEGATASVNDSIRGKGSFERTKRAISLLVKNNCDVTVRMTFFNQSESEVDNLMRFTSKMGANCFNFRYVVPVGEAACSEVSSEQYCRIASKVWEIGKEIGLKVGFSDPFPEILINSKKRKHIENNSKLKEGVAVTGCSIGFNLLYLDPQGIVKACPYFPVECADAKKESLSEIWYQNNTLKNLRHIRSVLEGKCGDCEYKFACGGCRGAALAAGNFLKEDPRCWK